MPVIIVFVFFTMPVIIVFVFLNMTVNIELVFFKIPLKIEIIYILINFNITNLRIVNPRCGWPNQKAIATSVGAKDVLKSSKIYNSLEKSIGDLDIIFASTSRIRKVNKKIISVVDLKKKIKKGSKIGILFGPEASGLSNDEISCADYLVKIPSNKRFSSLNLSHSAIIFCFELFQHFSKKNYKYRAGYKLSLIHISEPTRPERN